MAKLALVRYGSDGEGPKDEKKSYTYVVNDNVRKGDRISPIVRHYSTQGKNTIYATTGVVQATAKNATTEKGKEMQKGLGGQEPTEVYTGKELGLGAQRGDNGKFVLEGRSSLPVGKRPEGEPYVAGKREQATRGGNIAAYMMTHGESDELSAKAKKSVETFESYSQAYIPTGKR